MAANNPIHGEAIIIAVDASIGGKKLIASDQFQSFLDELGTLVNTIGDGEAQTLVTISAQLGKAKSGISANSKNADDLEQLGIQNELNPEDEFLQEKFFKALIRMINRWSSVNLDLGITIPTAPANELGNPESTDDALITSLAIDGQKIAKVIAPGPLRKSQKIYYRQMKAAFGLWPEQSMPASMPLGQGNNIGPRTKRFFPDVETVGADSNTSLGT